MTVLTPNVKDTPEKLRDHIITRYLENHDIVTEIVEFAVEEMADEGWHHEGPDCVEWIVENETDTYHKEGDCERELEESERIELDRWITEYHYANHGIGAPRLCQFMPCRVMEGLT